MYMCGRGGLTSAPFVASTVCVCGICSLVYPPGFGSRGGVGEANRDPTPYFVGRELKKTCFKTMFRCRVEYLGPASGRKG